MSNPANVQDGTGILVSVPGLGILQAFGETVPTDGTATYATGCLFHKTNGGNGTALYLNEGTVASCDFNAINP